MFGASVRGQPQPPLVQIEWTQPFHWGLLLAYEEATEFQMPELDQAGSVAATASCLAVPVRHAQDMDSDENVAPDAVLPWATVRVTVMVGVQLLAQAEFEARLRCPSGRLVIGDAEQERVVEVPPGVLVVRVLRDGGQYAERVTLSLGQVPSRSPSAAK